MKAVKIVARIFVVFILICVVLALLPDIKTEKKVADQPKRIRVEKKAPVAKTIQYKILQKVEVDDGYVIMVEIERNSNPSPEFIEKLARQIWLDNRESNKNIGLVMECIADVFNWKMIWKIVFDSTGKMIDYKYDRVNL